MRTASVCGVMNEFERDEIAKGFADLMAALENAAILTIEGQSAERPLALLQEDVNRLWPMMTGCIGTLASLDRRLDQAEKRAIR